MSRDYSLGERVDIVGIDTDEEERTCEMHPEGCGRALIAVGLLVRVKKREVVIDGVTETALGVYYFHEGDDNETDGEWDGGPDPCLVGYLGRHLVKFADHFNNKLIRIETVFSAEFPNLAIKSKWWKQKGFRDGLVLMGV
jgi:hypothetical protein